MKAYSILMVLLAAPVVASFTSCSNDEDGTPLMVMPESVTLMRSDTEQMSVKDGRAVKWGVENPYYATIRQNGILSAHRVGKTQVIATDSEGNTSTVEVEIVARYNTFEEPHLIWGATMDEVIEVENRSLNRITDISLCFNGRRRDVPFFFYLFDDYGNLIQCDVLIENSNSDEVGEFLLERYKYIGGRDEKYYYLNATKDMGVIKTVYSTEYTALHYVPFSDDNNKSLKANSTEKIIDLLGEQLGDSSTY